MLMLIQAFLFVQLFTRLLFVHADVSIVKPTSGASYSPESGSDSIDIEIVWEESVDLPSISSYDYFTFSLLYGPGTDMDLIDKVEEVAASNITLSESQYSYTPSFSIADAGNGQFFIQVYAYSKELGYTIHYSPRFKITSISGGATTYTYTTDSDAVPTPEWSLANSGIDTKSFTVPYTQQTGIRRYAPMQTQPGTAITVTTWSRRYATSAVTYYTSLRNSLEQMTTYTPGWSYSRTSDYNYATPAPFPSDNGGWYDPTDRQTLTTRKLNNKRR
ncbi:Kre9p [Kluyveromyces lactis]|uniref:KLLA0A06468p n=1 Tax=Kluyveromyces lactis (strain ATCC 8585 / CBS 2359 / DSM 70799 / NBRC 1267 / NRRL Y-1140 / WM37) TaxID=284590 RepID=Q6CXQ1_KLULA|nr:uncharacterized protein KLLA0_A06468g [Kluyveromyces lactis]CAH02876.1 KLLA0A06468p [Kluyveromyces lactis]|eukprot:XP_451288.1 uncharacterized protein KLLA0_A06468g [Kluyveromyces lactis]